MDIANLTAETREASGKGVARKLRSQGRIPGILYGSDTGNIKLSVDAQALNRMFHDPKYSRGLIDLEITGGEPYRKTVIIKESQTDPVKAKHLHLDFYEIKMDQKISTTVAVTTRGEARGVEEGGILQIIRRELDVYCLPKDIPEHIEIDVTELGLGESLHVSEISLDGDIEIPYDADFTVVTVVSPKMERAAEEVEGAEGIEEVEEGGEVAGGTEEE